MKITEYPKTASASKDDVLLMDGTKGTAQITFQDAAASLSSASSEPAWVAHRNTYRGKNLGDTYTEEQKAMVANGTFDDLYVGDYWENPSILGTDSKPLKWHIADINYWLNTGDQSREGVQTPHVVIVPRGFIGKANMNDTNVVTGGYFGSKMYSTNLGSLKNKITSMFGDNNRLIHREYISNATKDGYVTAGCWVEGSIYLMNQLMVYGSEIYPQLQGTTWANHSTIDKTQLALFKLRPDFITINEESYWLRDVVSPSHFATVAWAGPASYGSASVVFGVRPVFAIIG